MPRDRDDPSFLGWLAYRLWYQPRAAVAESIAAGGPGQQWVTASGRQAMMRAAETLPTARNAPAPNLPELHFLTGRKFWYQTAFCLHSLQQTSGLVFRVVFHDDGSLDPVTQGRLRRLFPAAGIRLRAENDARLTEVLPPSRFPYLQDRRRQYPNILKLTDAHAGARGWRLVLDSDMLFFRRPDFLLNWLAAPAQPLHMVDIQDSYGYPLPLMAELAGAKIPSRVNVGLCGLQSESLDWEKIEFWCRRLIEAHGTSYYLEQALVAMLVATRDCAIAPAQDYVLAPAEAECRKPRAVLHHYVAASKRGYFRDAWKVCAGVHLK